MELPQEAIRELQEIQRRLTGESLTQAEAQTMAQELFRLFLAVYEPIPEKWLEEFPHLKHDLTSNN